MTGMVNTVQGPVLCKELGMTLMHEHFLFGFPGFAGNSLYRMERGDIVKAGVAFALQAKAYGVKTIVDPTPNDCGRNVEVLKEISERSELQLICSTGYYYEQGGASVYFKKKQSAGQAEEEIYELFMGEITNGIGKTGIKPGVIKLASGKDRISPYEEMFFRVAARVQKETGVTLVTHTQDGTMGPEQAELLVSEGADPSRILIGHMCGNTDLAYHLRTLEKGVFIGFDRFGLQGAGRPMDTERMEVLTELIGKGYAGQLMLSQDSVCILLGKPLVRSEEAKKLLENWHFSHIFENIVPALRKQGVTERQLHMMLTDNPRKIFGGSEK